MAKDDDLMKFEISGDEDDWSNAVEITAYDIGEAIDKYHRILAKRRAKGTAPSLDPGKPLYARVKGEEGLYEFETSKSWEEMEQVDWEEELEAAEKLEISEEPEEEDEES